MNRKTLTLGLTTKIQHIMKRIIVLLFIFSGYFAIVKILFRLIQFSDRANFSTRALVEASPWEAPVLPCVQEEASIT
jgi:hypothetical protein